MSCKHIEIPCLGIPVIQRHGVVQRKVVAGQATSHHRSMSREYRRYRKLRPLYIEESGSGHPFVELSDHLVGRTEVVAVETLYHLSCSISEQGGFLIVPVSCQGIHAEPFPVFGQNIVLIRQELLEIHQYRGRLSLDVPSADTESQPLGRSLCLPVPVQERILDEIRIALRIHPHIGTHQNMMPFQFCLEIQGFGREDGIYAAHLVADLPADFKQIVRSDQIVVHLLCLLCCP